MSPACTRRNNRRQHAPETVGQAGSLRTRFQRVQPPERRPRLTRRRQSRPLAHQQPRPSLRPRSDRNPKEPSRRRTSTMKVRFPSAGRASKPRRSSTIWLLITFMLTHPAPGHNRKQISAPSFQPLSMSLAVQPNRPVYNQLRIAAQQFIVRRLTPARVILAPVTPKKVHRLTSLVARSGGR